MKPDVWTDAEIAVLKENRKVTNEEMAKILPSRSLSAIYNKRAQLGLGRLGSGNRRMWTEADLQFMRDNPHLSDAEMAKALGARLGSLSQARKAAKIRKVYRCVKCDKVIGSQGKWCKEHTVAARRWSQYANKAATRGFEFKLTHDDLHDLLDKDCAYCGGKGGGIDRIDSSKGYVLGNVNPCCWECNQMKNDLPLKDWLAKMKKVIQHIGGEQ